MPVEFRGKNAPPMPQPTLQAIRNLLMSQHYGSSMDYLCISNRGLLPVLMSEVMEGWCWRVKGLEFKLEEEEKKRSIQWGQLLMSRRLCVTEELISDYGINSLLEAIRSGICPRSSAVWCMVRFEGAGDESVYT